MRALAVAMGIAAIVASGPTWSQQPPPRTISDITTLLDQYKPDPERVAALTAASKSEPPPTQDRKALARFYQGRARAARELGAVDRPLADLRRAYELDNDSTPDSLRILSDLISAERHGGNILNAVRLQEELARKAESVKGVLAWSVNSYSSFAAAHASIGDLPSARRALARVEADFPRLQRLSSWNTRGNYWTGLLERARATVLAAEGKLADAEVVFRRALTNFEQEVPLNRELFELGQTTASPDRGETSLELVEINLASILMQQGKLAEAEIGMRNVLKRTLTRVGKYSWNTGRVAQEFAQILFEQGRYAEAEKMALAAVDIFKYSGALIDSRDLLQANRSYAAALVAQARWSDALSVYEGIQASVAMDHIFGQWLARGDVNWALALIKVTRAADAVPMLESMLGQTRDRLGPDHYQTAEQRGFLAIALSESGQRERALKEFAQATRVLLARGRVDAEEETGGRAKAWRRALILEGYIKLLLGFRGTGLGPNAGFDPAAEAFRLSDAARGQSTQRALAEAAARSAAATPSLAEVVRSEQDAHQQLAVLYQLLLRMLAAPADQQLPQVVAQMRTRIQELEKERRALLADLEKRFPAYTNLIDPRPATVEEARAALHEGEALVSILATDERTYVWVVPKQGPVAFHAANLGEKQVSRIVVGLRRALDPGEVPLERFPEFDVTAAHRLYAELMKPVEGAWKGAHTLMLVANGSLGQLPFTVLPTEPVVLPADAGLRFERYRAVPWLVSQIAVTQLPAVSTLVTLRALPQGNSARSPFIGFGDPQFGKEAVAAPPAQVTLRMRNLAVPRIEGEQPKAIDWIAYSQLAPLPDTREEMLSIATALKADPQKDVFLGAQASKENVMKADLRTRRIVAFATHGLIPGDFPNLEEPALALSAPDGNAETGLLTLGDILGLKMDADWVVLSACNTAAGDGAGAEAISGLGRGFFYAGSRALLVTHWPVETRSARLLVSQTFERYANTPGMSRAEALKQASLAVMQSNAESGGKPLFSYAHPVFWAPYALIGDGGR